MASYTITNFTPLSQLSNSTGGMQPGLCEMTAWISLGLITGTELTSGLDVTVNIPGPDPQPPNTQWVGKTGQPDGDGKHCIAALTCVPLPKLEGTTDELSVILSGPDGNATWTSPPPPSYDIGVAPMLALLPTTLLPSNTTNSYLTGHPQLSTVSVAGSLTGTARAWHQSWNFSLLEANTYTIWIQDPNQNKFYYLCSSNNQLTVTTDDTNPGVNWNLNRVNSTSYAITQGNLFLCSNGNSVDLTFVSLINNNSCWTMGS